MDQYPSIDLTVTLAEMTTEVNVRTVIVDGKVIMKDRQFLTIDVEPVKRRISSNPPTFVALYMCLSLLLCTCGLANESRHL